MSVFAMHGIVKNADKALFAHRNIDDTDAFASHLSRREPYVSMGEALEGRGDALTIDDSTNAAADAAEVARQHGHEVTLFLNPFNVNAALPHAFSLLHFMLDILKGTVVFDAVRFEALSLRDRNNLHSTIKKHLCSCVDEQSQHDIVRAIALAHGVDFSRMPAHLAPPDRERLIRLQKSGVAIENHGWMHLHRDALSVVEHSNNVENGRIWLRQELNASAEHYAVPFGVATIEIEQPPEHERWYLLDHRLPSGAIFPRIINRLPLMI